MIKIFNNICYRLTNRVLGDNKFTHVNTKDITIILIVGVFCYVSFISALSLFNSIAVVILQGFLILYLLSSIYYILFVGKKDDDYDYLRTLPFLIMFLISYCICYRFIPYRGDDLKILRKEKIKKLNRKLFIF